MDLCAAAHQGNIIGLRVLVAQGTDVNSGDYDARCAIHLAASEGRLEVLRFLIEDANATVDPIDRWGNTPLDDARRQGHHECAKYLMQYQKTTNEDESPSGGGSGGSGGAADSGSDGAMDGSTQSTDTWRSSRLSVSKLDVNEFKRSSITTLRRRIQMADFEDDGTDADHDMDLSRGKVGIPMDPFKCPLTGKPFTDPVIAMDGYTYERADIILWW